MERAAFSYNSHTDYTEYSLIGAMDVRCSHCNALKFVGETPGMCCSDGKVKLPVFESPPEPLRSLIFGTSETSKHFLTNIRKYNAAFQMTSFGATKIVRDNFMPTFKVINSRIASTNGSFNKMLYDFLQYTDSRSNLPPSWVIVAITRC